MEIEKYESVKKWLIKPNGERRYDASTELEYVPLLKTFCEHLQMKPHQLAKVTNEKMLIIQKKLFTFIEQEYSFRKSTIKRKIGIVRQFWRSNGQKLSKEVREYASTPELKSENKAEYSPKRIDVLLDVLHDLASKDVWVQIKDVAEEFKVQSGANRCSSRSVGGLLKYLGFTERKRGTGGYTFVKVRQDLLDDLTKKRRN